MIGFNRTETENKTQKAVTDHKPSGHCYKGSFCFNYGLYFDQVSYKSTAGLFPCVCRLAPVFLSLAFLLNPLLFIPLDTPTKLSEE